MHSRHRFMRTSLQSTMLGLLASKKAASDIASFHGLDLKFPHRRQLVSVMFGSIGRRVKAEPTSVAQACGPEDGWVEDVGEVIFCT